MRIALFLPHVGVFGGVRRYLELGNEWVALGHEVTLHHPDGAPPAWLPFAGRTATLASAAGSHSDLALCGDGSTYAAFRAHDARRHVYYCVLEGDPGLPAAIADRAVTLMANSGPLRRQLERRTRRPVLDGAGGIRARALSSAPELRADRPVARARQRPSLARQEGHRPGAARARGLVGRVPAFETVLFDALDPQTNRQDPRDGAPLPPNARFVLDPSQDELAALYQSSHVFVAAERKAGWCNTALEALACGCALVCTRSGTPDFARHRDNALVELAEPVVAALGDPRAAHRCFTPRAARGRGAGQRRAVGLGPAGAEDPRPAQRS